MNLSKMNKYGIFYTPKLNSNTRAFWNTLASAAYGVPDSISSPKGEISAAAVVKLNS